MKSYKRLSPEVRAVIDVVREALDVPAAAPYPGDQERRAEILDTRIRMLLRELAYLAGLPSDERVDVVKRADDLRGWLDCYPATGYSHAGDTKDVHTKDGEPR